jgi:hypothetical protein
VISRGRWRAIALVLVVASGCSGKATTALVVVSSTSAQTLEALSLEIQLASPARDEQHSLSTSLPARVLVVLPSVSSRMTAILTAVGSDGSRQTTTGFVDTLVGKQVTLALTLDGGALAEDMSLADAAADDLAGPPHDLAPATLLYDDFAGTGLDSARWTATVNGAATITQPGDGYLHIHLPASANVWADVASAAVFPVGATFEARVGVSAGQIYDHKAIGFSNARVGADCFSGETESAIWRGQDTDLYVQPKTANVGACTLELEPSYPSSLPPAALDDFQIVRVDSSQVDFYDNGARTTTTTDTSTMSLPIRFSAYTYTTAPANRVDIVVDWVRVTRP